MDCDLKCNMKKCRKRLSSGIAWATSCSHIFCNEDGENYLVKDKVCPTCSLNLNGRLDFVRIDMNPSESYKSMALVGQRPDLIMDICSRAMSFWVYQNQQDHMYQDFMMTKSKERYANLKRYCDQIGSNSQLEIKAIKSQLSNAKAETESTKKICTETSDKLREKTRQYQKLQSMYNTLRMTSLQPPSNHGSRRADFNLFDVEMGQGDTSGRGKDSMSIFDVPFGGSNHPSRNSSPGHKRNFRSSSPLPFEMRFSQPNTPFLPPQAAMFTGTEEVSRQRNFTSWAQSNK